MFEVHEDESPPNSNQFHIISNNETITHISICPAGFLLLLLSTVLFNKNWK